MKVTHEFKKCFQVDIKTIYYLIIFKVAAYEARKLEAEAQGRKLEPDALVRPKIKLFSCLEAFTQMEIVEQFYSTALNAKTTARK